jgi:coenzyme F420-reducing hydrogenase beta subunit
MKHLDGTEVKRARLEDGEVKVTYADGIEDSYPPDTFNLWHREGCRKPTTLLPYEAPA